MFKIPDDRIFELPAGAAVLVCTIEDTLPERLVVLPALATAGINAVLTPVGRYELSRPDEPAIDPSRGFDRIDFVALWSPLVGSDRGLLTWRAGTWPRWLRDAVGTDPTTTFTLATEIVRRCATCWSWEHDAALDYREEREAERDRQQLNRQQLDD